MSITGKIHSIETCGTVDGPGIRFVIFMQGCPLRCKYCHNPDTWKLGDGTEKTVDEIFDEIKKYKSYMNFSGGGVTITGGEPLLQATFAKELFIRCKEEGIHTAIDTSGYLFNDTIKEVLTYTDLVLLDIKCYDSKQYKYITGAQLEPTIEFINYLGEINKPVWIRYVLVPNLSDNKKHIEALSIFLSKFNNIQRIELLPFHKMGEYKWEELGYKYELTETKEPTKEEILNAMSIFKAHNLNVVTN